MVNSRARGDSMVGFSRRRDTEFAMPMVGSPGLEFTDPWSRSMAPDQTRQRDGPAMYGDGGRGLAQEIGHVWKR